MPTTSIRALLLLVIAVTALSLPKTSDESPRTHASPPGEELLYLFEIGRHGAKDSSAADRSPTRPSSVPVQQLTPMGLRQSFLLGRYNYEKYGGQAKHSSIKMQSTNPYRNIQTGYANLLGFSWSMANKTRPQLARGQLESITERDGRGAPPFTVRRQP